MLFLAFLIKLGNELGAEAHCPEPPFDFGNLLIINRGAKLIVGNKPVIGGTEGLKHGLVFIGERGDKHDERHKTADEEASAQNTITTAAATIVKKALTPVEMWVYLRAPTAISSLSSAFICFKRGYAVIRLNRNWRMKR